MKISIKTGDAEKEIIFFGEFQKNTIPALISAINAYAIKLRDYIATSKLSGQILKVRTGTLRSGIVPKLARLVGTKIEAELETNVVYARIHEYGGTIVPTNAQALTIPFPGIKGRARDFKNTWLWKSGLSGKAPVIMQRLTSPKGRKTSYRPLFTLVKSVTMPARPYILPSIRETENDLIEGIRKSLNKIAEEGK